MWEILTLHCHLNCYLCIITIRSNPFFLNFSERPANCCRLWWHPKISRNTQAILTHRPWMVTRWCTSPTDWIFSVNCSVTPSCLELFRLPFRSEAFSIQMVISISLQRVPFKICFCVWVKWLSFYYGHWSAFFQLCKRNTEGPEMCRVRQQIDLLSWDRQSFLIDWILPSCPAAYIDFTLTVIRLTRVWNSIYPFISIQSMCKISLKVDIKIILFKRLFTLIWFIWVFYCRRNCNSISAIKIDDKKL